MKTRRSLTGDCSRPTTPEGKFAKCSAKQVRRTPAKRPRYVPGEFDSWGVKTDFNTDYQRALSGSAVACYRVGLAFLRGDERNNVQQNFERSVFFLESAKGPRVKALLKEARRGLKGQRTSQEKARALFDEGITSKKKNDWVNAHALFKAAAALGCTLATAEINARARVICENRRQRDLSKRRKTFEVRTESFNRNVDAAIGRRIQNIRTKFATDNGRAAVEMANVYLDYVVQEGCFESARDWLNVAKDNGVIDVELLTRMARICEFSCTTFLENRELAHKYYKLAAEFGGVAERRRLELFEKKYSVKKVGPKHYSRHRPKKSFVQRKFRVKNLESPVVVKKRAICPKCGILLRGRKCPLCGRISNQFSRSRTSGLRSEGKGRKGAIFSVDPSKDNTLEELRGELYPQ